MRLYEVRNIIYVLIVFLLISNGYRLGIIVGYFVWCQSLLWIGELCDHILNSPLNHILNIGLRLSAKLLFWWWMKALFFCKESELDHSHCLEVYLRHPYSSCYQYVFCN